MTELAVIDTGLGMASLKDAARHLFAKTLTAVATHVHYDHVGGFHEFEDRIIHRAEAAKAAAGNAASLYGAGKEDALLESIRAAGYDVPPQLFTAVPSAASRVLCASAARSPRCMRLISVWTRPISSRRSEVGRLTLASSGRLRNAITLSVIRRNGRTISNCSAANTKSAVSSEITIESVKIRQE